MNDIIEAAEDAIRDDEAVARFRSTRSTKTGPGSRGGTMHLPGVRNAYFREWRANHPGYNDQAARNRREAHRKERLERDAALVEQAIESTPDGAWFADWVRGQMQRRNLSHRALADLAGLDQSVFSRLLAGIRSPDFGTVIAIAHALGYEINLRRKRRAA